VANHICKACGNSFFVEIGSTKKFCSVACQYATRRRKYRVCKYCGKSYQPSLEGGQAYCSRECVSLSQQKRVESDCLNCGKSIVAAHSAKRIYCSKECHDQARQKWYTCQNCGKQYHPGPNGGRKYCSRECSAMGRTLKRERTCEVCGNTFIARATSNQRYCSQKCNSVVQQQRRRETGYYSPKVELTCDHCGKSFLTTPGLVINKTLNSKKRFCSKECKYAARRQKWPLEKTNLISYTCQECGKQWYDKPSLKHRKKYCSRACVGSATIRRLQTESPTSIELLTYQALRDLEIEFEPQHRIGKWVVDAYLPALNVIIECQGDFHHCNPAIFPDGPRYAIQRKIRLVP